MKPPPLTCGDNLTWLKSLASESVDLIYLDPPFMSQADYGDFGDKWKWDPGDEEAKKRLLGKLPNWTKATETLLGLCGMLSYLYYMAERLIECARVLTEKGSIYLHCDDSASHHLRGLLDAVFGSKCFRNHISWKRSHAHSDPGRFGRITDHILYYARPGATWNTQHTPYTQDYIDTWFKGFDERGRYMTNCLTGPGTSNGPSGQPWRGYDPAKSGKGRCWSVPKRVCVAAGVDVSLPPVEKLELLDAAGYIHWPKKPGGVPTYKQYLHLMDGRVVQDIWDDINSLQGFNKTESVGYATQKPLALLERIVNASSKPGDLVMDPFCGSGTTLVAAAKLGRRYLGCDVNTEAVAIAQSRLDELSEKKAA